MADSEDGKPALTEGSPLVRSREFDEPEMIKAESATTYEAMPTSLFSSEKPTLFERIRGAKSVASGDMDYVVRALPEILYCGDICFGVLLILIAVIHVVFIVFGAVYLHECPRQDYIPLYLIVAGVAGILFVFIPAAELIHRLRTEDDNNDGVFMKVLKSGFRIVIGESESKKTKAIKIAILCYESIIWAFMFAWFITGSVWVFSVYNDYSHDENSHLYCNEVIYMFAFVVLLIKYALLAMVLCWVLGALLLGCCIASKMNS